MSIFNSHSSSNADGTRIPATFSFGASSSVSPSSARSSAASHQQTRDRPSSVTADLDFKRRMLEGTVAESDEKEDDDEESSLSHDAAKRLNLNSGAASSYFPLNTQHSSSSPSSSAYAAMFPPPPSPTSSSTFARLCRCSTRLKTFIVLSIGVALILLVIILFIVLLNKNLRHNHQERANRNAFRMQLLGQVVLRYDIKQDENTSQLSLASEWTSDWSSQLSGDFVLTDFETSLTGMYGGVNWRRNEYAHIAPGTTIDVLLSLGLNTYVCANNHVFDLGLDGIYNILAAMKERNLTCPGIGMNLPQAAGPTFIADRTSKGIALGIVAMASGGINETARATLTTPGINALRVGNDSTVNADDLSVQNTAINTATSQIDNDLIGIVHHNHYQLNASAPLDEVEQWRIDLAHSFIDQGAQFYVSHGVPYTQGIEIYKSAPIFYGLGNFIFQSMAGSARWGEQAYESIIVDIVWGCIPCPNENIPVATVAPIKMARKAAGFIKRMFEEITSSSPSPASASLSLPSSTPSSPSSSRPSSSSTPPSSIFSGSDFLEMSTDEELHDLTSSSSSSASMDVDVEPREGSHITPNAFLDPPSAPPSSVPVSKSGCRCGYTVSSILLRPVLLFDPSKSSTPPPELDFNHTFGLPTLTMPQMQARAILERVQTLSQRFGTRMEIIHAVGGSGIELGKDECQGGPCTNSTTRIPMHSDLFARINLRQ